MAEYSANAEQLIPPGGSLTFTLAPVPCERGFVRWRPGSGAFNLSGWVPNRGCGCNNFDASASYLVDFGTNIAVPEGQTVGEISVAFALDGVTIPDTTMIVTPAAVDEYFNVSRATNIKVWRNCCQTLTVINTSDIPINVQNANIIFSRPDLAVTY